jgi:putative inorganic carbon (HCO3(-)) transporter
VLWAVVQSRVIAEIQPFFDYMSVFVLTARLISDEKRREWLGITFSVIALVIVARNLGPLSAPIRIGGLKAGYFLGDNNDFAWGLVVILPLILHLFIGKRRAWVRLVAAAGLIACIAGVIGSGSRGGSIGLCASFFYLWMFVSPYKGRLAALLLLAGCVVLAFAPSTYLERMASVGSYEEDSSAQARLQVWKAGFHMALDFPLGVGAGNFPSAYGRYYVPPEEQNAIAWAGQRWLAAHSIYFRAMGEYGFLGFFMMLWLIVRTFRDNERSRKQLLAKPEADATSPYWPAMLNASVVGYAVCGIFLGGITYPHIFLLAGLTVALKERLNAPSAPVSRRRRG